MLALVPRPQQSSCASRWWLETMYQFWKIPVKFPSWSTTTSNLLWEICNYFNL
jgi:hypothetical protein